MVIKKTALKSSAEQNLEARAKLFKALGHPTRLLLLNLIRNQPRHGEELAAILQLNSATISHHLAQLVEVGLLCSEKAQYYQIYSLQGDRLETKLADMIALPQPELPSAAQVDAYRNKVIDIFFEQGRLKQIPAQVKKRQIILDVIVQEFEPERAYSEQEVNRILLEFHEDVAALRRELISQGLMQRNQGIYQRVLITEANSAP